MTGSSQALDLAEDSRRPWSRIAVVAGLLALFCYLFSVVFHDAIHGVGVGVVTRSVSRILFYAFGPSLTLAAYAIGFLLRGPGGSRPFFRVGVLFTCIAGVAVNMMAVIQDTNFTMMGEAIAKAELEATKDALKQILWGVNWVQLSLDLVFDIWITGGCFFLALGAFLYLRQRIFGGLGMLIAALTLGFNFATLPHPPAEAGLVDLGPLVAAWFGCFLGLVVLRNRRREAW